MLPCAAGGAPLPAPPAAECPPLCRSWPSAQPSGSPPALQRTARPPGSARPACVLRSNAPAPKDSSVSRSHRPYRSSPACRPTAVRRPAPAHGLQRRSARRTASRRRRQRLRSRAGRTCAPRSDRIADAARRLPGPAVASRAACPRPAACRPSGACARNPGPGRPKPRDWPTAGHGCARVCGCRRPPDRRRAPLRKCRTTDPTGSGCRRNSCPDSAH